MRWTVGWCLYHVKASSQSLEVLENTSIPVLTQLRCDCMWTIVGSKFDIRDTSVYTNISWLARP